MRQQPDPRAAASRARILAAARKTVMAEGPGAVTLAHVAEQAGVGRATIYRHWRDQDALLDEVMDEFSLPFFAEPRAPLRPWLIGQLRRLADELTTPEVARMTTTLVQRAATGETSAVERRDRLFATIETRLQHVLHLAGTARPGTVADDALGPLLYHCLLRGEPAPQAFVERLADGLLTPVPD
jgi:AcrR family transcriptional regulator